MLLGREPLCRRHLAIHKGSNILGSEVRSVVAGHVSRRAQFRNDLIFMKRILVLSLAFGVECSWDRAPNAQLSQTFTQRRQQLVEPAVHMER